MTRSEYNAVKEAFDELAKKMRKEAHAMRTVEGHKALINAVVMMEQKMKDILKGKESELYEETEYDYRGNGPRNLHISGLFFKCTCFSCPEQYDVFTAAGEQVGYVRLRHGSLYAEYPDVGGECVYDTEAFAGDGSFLDDKERIFHLTKIADALMAKEMEKWCEREED